MQKVSPATRIEWIDFAKGVAIILVVWGHGVISDIDAFTSIFIGNDNGLLLSSLWFLPVLLCAEIIFVKLFARLNQFGAKVFASGIVLAALVGFNVKNFSSCRWDVTLHSSRRFFYWQAC